MRWIDYNVIYKDVYLAHVELLRLQRTLEQLFSKEWLRDPSHVL